MSTLMASGFHLQVPLRNLLLCGCALPLVSFFACVILSILKDFEASTRTHCGVYNFLPSLSSATGDFSPQKYIWRIGVALHSFPRVVEIIIIYNFYRSSTRPMAFHVLNIINTFLVSVEVFGLLILTFVASVEHYGTHKFGFIAFLSCSLLSMMITCILNKLAAAEPRCREETLSLKYKRLSMMVNYISFLTAMYFYARHNWYCEPGMYSMFALAEYMVIVSNICFHGTICYDMNGVNIILAPEPVLPMASVKKL